MYKAPFFVSQRYTIYITSNIIELHCCFIIETKFKYTLLLRGKKNIKSEKFLTQYRIKQSNKLIYIHTHKSFIWIKLV
jgi:hypothetical protein